MKFTNKDLYFLLFTELLPNQARYNTCQKVYKSDNGYTNQVHHLLKHHPDYQELAVAAFRKGNCFGLTLPDQRTSDEFHWIECTIKCRAALPTQLAPVLRNVTRWSSVFSMVEHYNKLHPMDHASISKHDIARFML
ncbi:hypothetical protein PI124_g828 [Phytophthora idaei]|nr:hypothetical protein PI124_g828 [Phytophthora idaei]